MNLVDILQEPWAWRALVASSLVGITCGMLGCFIVLRNMSLIGDALSHAVLPGVVVAFSVLGYHTTGFFAGSVLAGLVAAVMITWIQGNVKTKSDAVIGIVFTAMFSIGVIGISAISRTGVHLDLKDFLFGNVLGVSDTDLHISSAVMVVVLLSIVVFYRYLFAATFQPTIAATMGVPVRGMHYYLMLLLSFAVVAAMQTVGVILVVAMLITPAATALLLRHRLPGVILLSAIIGLLSSLSGLLLSIRFEFPPGPAIAVTATVFYLLAVFLSPSQGLIFIALRRYRQRGRIRAEDVLKAMYKDSFQSGMAPDALANRLGIGHRKLQAAIRQLIRREQLRANADGTLRLTETGRQAADELIRAHRLWESYLATEYGLQEDQVHDEAERLEHLLTPEQVDLVDRHLGFPAVDPHGSPIPAPGRQPAQSLADLTPSQRGMISRRQPGADIPYQLWELGIGPGDAFEVLESEGRLRIRTEAQDVDIPTDLARRISVDLSAG